MGDGFYRSKDPTNSIKVLKEATKDKSNNGNNKNTHAETIMHTKRYTHIKHSKSPSLQYYGVMFGAPVAASRVHVAVCNFGFFSSQHSF